MIYETDLLKPYLNKGQKILDVELPIICGAMSSISERNLVSAVANAGGFGVLAGGTLTASTLKKEIDATCKLTSKPFGVNLILNNKNFPEQLSMALDDKPEIIVLAGAIPDGTIIGKVKASGKKVMCFAPSLIVANMLIGQGADALIVEGSEAGGHIGPNTTLTLIQEVLLNIQNIPVFVAGGVATGEVMAVCFLLGAAGIQVGTRFAASKESIAHDLFKKALIKAKSHNTIRFTPTPPVASGNSVRCIKNQAYTEFSMCIDQLKKQISQGGVNSFETETTIEEFWQGRLSDAVVNGNTKTGALMSGESVGFVKESLSVEDILKEFVCAGELFVKKIKKQDP